MPASNTSRPSHLRGARGATGKPAAGKPKAETDDKDKDQTEGANAEGEDKDQTEGASAEGEDKDQTEGQRAEGEDEDEDGAEEGEGPKAAAQERNRIKGILGHKDAVGREGLAHHLAFNTAMPVTDAVAALAASPKSAEGKTGLAGRMAGIGATPVSATGGGADPAADAAERIAKYARG